MYTVECDEKEISTASSCTLYTIMSRKLLRVGRCTCVHWKCSNMHSCTHLSAHVFASKWIHCHLQVQNLQRDTSTYLPSSSNCGSGCRSCRKVCQRGRVWGNEWLVACLNIYCVGDILVGSNQVKWKVLAVNCSITSTRAVKRINAFLGIISNVAIQKP